jgi:lysophospholipase L1-like esterase
MLKLLFYVIFFLTLVLLPSSFFPQENISDQLALVTLGKWSRLKYPEQQKLVSPSKKISCIILGHQFRITQSGKVNKIKIKSLQANKINSWKIQIWRNNGGNFDLIGESENIAQSLADQESVIALSKPIKDVREGDYYGFSAEGDLQELNMESIRTDQVNTFCSTDTTTKQLSWLKQNKLADSALMIHLYMDPPQIIFLGDSIIGGYPEHFSFLEKTEKTNLKFAIPYKYGELTKQTYQNAGIGSESMYQIADRFDRDVIQHHPQIVVVEGGVNDLYRNHSYHSFISSWKKILDQAERDKSIKKIVVLKILPWTNGSEQQMIRRDQWNTSLTLLSAGYTKAIVVDTSSYIGQKRGDVQIDNLWNITNKYTPDGVHLNSSGNDQVVQAIIDALNQDLMMRSWFFPTDKITPIL